PCPSAAKIRSALVMSDALIGESGLFANGLTRTTVPDGVVKRKNDQPNHSILTGPVAAGAVCASAVSGVASIARIARVRIASAGRRTIYFSLRARILTSRPCRRKQVGLRRAPLDSSHGVLRDRRTTG